MLRQDLTTNKALGRRGKAAGLNLAVMQNPGHVPGVMSDRTMATTIEALIGAVYLDVGGGGKGLDRAKEVADRLGLLDHELLKASATVEGAQDVVERLERCAL